MGIDKKRSIKIVNKKRFAFSFFIISMCFGLIFSRIILRSKQIVQASNNMNLLKEENEFIVVIDPGHGGIDKGAIQGELYEKDLTLKISEIVKKELISKGCTVFMTREDDIGIDLKERYVFANSKDADVFVSIHINSNNDSIHKGMSTYYYDINGIQEKERKELAKSIQKEIIKSDNWTDKGILKQDIAVLKGSNMPSVLVECGFITNSEDREKLQEESVIENIATNISQGILNYLGI